MKNENISTKGEIAPFEQFLLLTKCFQQLSAAELSGSVCMRERVNVKAMATYLGLVDQHCYQDQ